MADRVDRKKNTSSNRLMLLVTIVNRKKAEYYTDLIQGYASNFQFVALGEGTADKSILSRLGLSDSEKAIIFSVIKEERQDEILRMIDDRFRSVKDGKGIAYTIPFSSVIGANIFNFLSDNRSTFI